MKSFSSRKPLHRPPLTSANLCILQVFISKTLIEFILS